MAFCQRHQYVNPSPKRCLWLWKKQGVRGAFFLALLLFPALSRAQSTFIPHDPDYYHLIDRFQIKFQSKKNRLFNGYKPIRRVDLSHFLTGLEAQYDRLSPMRFMQKSGMSTIWKRNMTVFHPPTGTIGNTCSMTTGRGANRPAMKIKNRGGTCSIPKSPISFTTSPITWP